MYLESFQASKHKYQFCLFFSIQCILMCFITLRVAKLHEACGIVLASGGGVKIGRAVLFTWGGKTKRII